MKRSETTVLLAKMAAYDRRTNGEADVAAWTEVMTKNDIPLGDALTAVADHFSASREWLMPIHIIDQVKAIRRERIQRAGTLPIPGELDQVQERAWTRLWCGAVKDGHPDPDSVANDAMDIRPQLTTGAPVPKELRDELIRMLAESKSIPEPEKKRKPKKVREEKAS